MGSRLKQNPERTFNWFFEATCPVATDKDPGVLFQFPEDLSNKESFQTLPKFCFPYDIQRVRDGVAVQHFTFVLTDMEGCQQYGFCRLTNSTNTCLCILSYLPWFEVFYKLLNNLADYLTKGQTKEMTALLAGLYKQPIPLEAGSVTLQMGEQILVNTEVSHPVRYPERQEGVPYFISPDPKSLPSIPENRNLTELIVAVDVGNLLQLYASLLFERRVLIFASKLSTLTSCVHALSAVLYPMYWQHIFIPVLPPHLLDYCCAPMPYLIGVHTSLSERVRSRGLEEVVILNVDTNTLETPFDDFKRIPSDVMTGLKVCLKRQAVSPGCGVSKAFLKAQALLFGGYRDALQGDKDGEMRFSEEMFLDHKSSSMRNFLQSAIHLQFFKQFIDGRLDILNKRMEPDDLFEEEILKCETSAGRSKSYQQLVGNIKKGGGALILNMKSKAHIKAKNLTKSGLKNLVTHKTHNQEHSLQRGGSVSHRRVQSDCLQNRLPITQHFGKSRPRRPVHKYRGQRDEEAMADTGDTWDGAASDPVVKPESEHRDVDEGEDSLLCDPEEMDLLGEIFDTLSTRSSHERGLLYGTRSLDLFGSDSHDYIMKHGFPANPSQESLSLSISGSGSLHSWNLETTEELSDVTEDSDWLCLDNGVGQQAEGVLAATEMGEQANEVQKITKHDENKATIKKNQDEETNVNNATDLRAEESRDRESKEKRVSLGEVTGREVAEKREDEEKVKLEYEQEQSLAVIQGQETREGKSKILKEVTSEQKVNENQENRDNREETESLNKLTKPSSHLPNTVQEQQAQNDVQYTGPPADQEKTKLEPAKEDEPEVRQTLSPPKVLSAVAHFQSRVHNQGFQVKSWAKDPAESKRACNMFQSREKAQTHLSCQPNKSEENHCSEGQEVEDPPSIKVSELKKRFEA